MKSFCLAHVAAILACVISGCANRSPAPETRTPIMSGNPVLTGWYADPEGAIFGTQYWIFPTWSARYNEQVFLDTFSSPDLVHWTKHSHVLDTNAVSWARRAMWAPAIAEKRGKYLLFELPHNDSTTAQEAWRSARLGRVYPRSKC